MMPVTTEQIMLTLAGLAYRGFHDPLSGALHDEIVRGAVLEGLQALTPVKGDWDLVWGPVTSRDAREIFDTNAMYVVRHTGEHHRYVVAIRGTNPISAADWLFGDFWVGITVPWPYGAAGNGAAISASTALGLGALQTMSSQPSGSSSAAAVSSLVGRAVDALKRIGGRVRAGDGPGLTASPNWFADRLRDLASRWPLDGRRARAFGASLQKALADGRSLPTDLRPRPRPATTSKDGLDLLTFLSREASAAGAALDVSVVGHSKGAALAQAVALWLREALDSPEERWDGGKGGAVHCHVFAAPTAGNAALAARIDRVLGVDHRHVRNMKDIVTHAWQVDELGEIPALYGQRTAPFEPLIAGIIEDVQGLQYRQPQRGVRPILGQLDDSRGFVPEFIHQHLEAYVRALELDKHGIDALTFFF